MGDKKIQYILFTLFMIVTAQFVSGQSIKRYVGSYVQKNKFDTGVVQEYELKLLKDGTFIFKFFENQVFFEKTNWGQGTWIVEGEDIIFSTAKNQVDDQWNYNFTGTKAYIDGKTLTFYETKIESILDIALKK